MEKAQSAKGMMEDGWLKSSLIPDMGGSSNTNVYRMWCGYGRLSDFPLSENRLISYLEIRFEEYSRQAEQKFIRDTEAHFNVPLGDTLYTYDKIKSGYTSAWQMLGNLLCLVSVILAAVDRKSTRLNSSHWS